MQRIRLSTNVVLEITDSVVSRAIDANPFLYLYEFGIAHFNNKLLVQQDGQTEERSKSYWPVASNVILSSTPTFYPDDVITPGFHADAQVSALIPGASSMLQYRKVRMLFAQGFTYSTQANASALTTLNIYAKRPSNNARIDLLAFYDSYDDSQILAIPQVLYGNQLFNQAIELEVLDLAYLYNSTQEDVVDFRTLLFGNDEIETLFIDHAGIQYSDIINFTQSGHNYKRFVDSGKNTSQWASRYSNDEIICVAEQEGDAISVQMIHERFDLEPFLNKTALVESLTYTFKYDEYDSLDNFLGSYVVAMSKPLNPFEKISHRFRAQADAAYIKVEIIGLIIDAENSKIERVASLVLADASIFKINQLDFEITEEKLITTVSKEVKLIQYRPDTPKIVQIDRPIYVQSQANAGEILLLPYAQAVKLNLEGVNLSNVRSTKLLIGINQFLNQDGDKTLFRLTADTYFTKETKWYLLDESDNAITYGKIMKA